MEEKSKEGVKNKSKRKRCQKRGAKKPYRPDCPRIVLGEVDVDMYVTRVVVRSLEATPSPRSVSTSNSRILDVIPAAWNRPTSLPDLHESTPAVRLQQLSISLGINDMGTNYCSFWILDNLAHILEQCELKGMSPKNQLVVPVWFQDLLKTIKMYRSTREQTFMWLNDLLKAASQLMVSRHTASIPSPSKCRKYLKGEIDSSQPSQSHSVDRLDKGGSIGSAHSSRGHRSSSVRSRQSSRVRRSRGDSSNHPSFTRPSVSSKLCADLVTMTSLFYKTFANPFIFYLVQQVFAGEQLITPIWAESGWNEPQKIMDLRKGERGTVPAPTPRKVIKTSETSISKAREFWEQITATREEEEWYRAQTARLTAETLNHFLPLVAANELN